MMMMLVLCPGYENLVLLICSTPFIKSFMCIEIVSREGVSQCRRRDYYVKTNENS